MKTVKTEDLDMEKELPTKRDHAIPGAIKRDTAANIEGGKQVGHRSPRFESRQACSWSFNKVVL